MTVVVAVVAGAVGAVCRYLLVGIAQAATRSDFPIGTLIVNLLGSFLLGTIAGAADSYSAPTIAAVGFMGGFTTFSTWMVETLRLGPRSFAALLNLVATLTGGVAAAVLGYALAN